jgi:hypothetical protein
MKRGARVWLVSYKTFCVWEGDVNDAGGCCRLERKWKGCDSEGAVAQPGMANRSVTTNTRNQRNWREPICISRISMKNPKVWKTFG